MKMSLFRRNKESGTGNKLNITTNTIQETSKKKEIIPTNSINFYEKETIQKNLFDKCYL